MKVHLRYQFSYLFEESNVKIYTVDVPEGTDIADILKKIPGDGLIEFKTDDCADKRSGEAVGNWMKSGEMICDKTYHVGGYPRKKETIKEVERALKNLSF